MRAAEFIVERKRRRRRPGYAAYGPGPYGGYGYYAGYSGDSGSDGGGDGGGGGESIENEDAMMAKIEDDGKIVRILKKQHSVPFSDEKNWLLIDTDPAKGNKGLGLKWVPASTRFTWVRPYRDTAKQDVAENLRQWFKDKWVRFGPDGKIRGDCARGSEKEGKPKCLPRSKANALGKKGRASAAARKRREDPNPDRKGAAINVSTKGKRK